MAKKAKADNEDLETGGQDTLPPFRDDAGFELDEHGLPVCGPERARRLNGAPDPALTDSPEDSRPNTDTQPNGQGDDNKKDVTDG